MFDIFGDLLKTVAKTAVDVVDAKDALLKDALTLGGTLTDQEKPYTLQSAEQLLDDANQVVGTDKE